MCRFFSELFSIYFELDPDGDDDTRRNNKCWLIWEVSSTFACCCI